MKNYKKVVTFLLVTLMVLSMSVAVLAEQTNTNAVNIRSGPSTSSALVGQVAKGTTFVVSFETVGETLNGSNVWYYIIDIACAAGSKHNIDGQSGYIHSSFVSGHTSSSSTSHPQSASQAFGSSTLKYGSRGNYVKNVQEALRKGGYYSGEIDGIYGGQTTTAVENFQRVYHYLLEENEFDSVVDGLVGPKTRSALWQIYGDHLKKHGFM